MFNLDLAIAEWRRQMIAGGITFPATLDELEGHMREETERQLRRGSDEQQAFEIAAQRMGNANLLKNEFQKNDQSSVMWERIRIGIGTVVVGIGLFLSVIMIVVGLDGWADRIVASIAVAASVLVACGWRYALPFLPVLATGKRYVVGLGCMAVGFSITWVFCTIILPHFVVDPDGRLPAIGLWAVFLIATTSCIGLGLLMGESDRKNLTMKRSGRRRFVRADS